MTAVPLSVLHLDAGRVWAGGQNQVRLLMRGLAPHGVRQLCLCPRGSPLERRLAEEGLPVRGIAWRGGADPRAALAIARAAGGFDVIHAHDAHALQVAIVPARLRRTPLVAARRVHFPTSARKWNLADRVIAISGTVRDALVRSGVDAHRIREVWSGIDADEVAGRPPLDPPLRARLGLGADAFVVGNIGHLHRYKGQTVIPAAAARLPDAHWVIIGEGPRRATIEAEIEAHGVAGRVHLTGALPDARRALREFDVFAFTSPDEPLGTSVLDAMAAGVPVVGADAAGAREILAPVHAATGASLYPPGDDAALAARVRRLRDDPALRDAVCSAQRRRLEDYRIERTVERTLAVYREVVEAG
ncbi:MAG TPA: glycosyltransferase family 4 protein [Longimicrobiales bacterium]